VFPNLYFDTIKIFSAGHVISNHYEFPTIPRFHVIQTILPLTIHNRINFDKVCDDYTNSIISHAVATALPNELELIDDLSHGFRKETIYLSEEVTNKRFTLDHPPVMFNQIYVLENGNFHNIWNLSADVHHQTATLHSVMRAVKTKYPYLKTIDIFDFSCNSLDKTISRRDRLRFLRQRKNKTIHVANRTGKSLLRKTANRMNKG
jgi:hypothetical protein